jgi:hypothetical protein
MRGNNRSNWTRIICASLAPSTNLGQNMIDFRSIGHIMLLDGELRADHCKQMAYAGQIMPLADSWPAICWAIAVLQVGGDPGSAEAVGADLGAQSCSSCPPQRGVWTNGVVVTPPTFCQDLQLLERVE